jgi:hypothetical protein
MALRSTFNEVIEAVRNETRLSSNTSRGIDHLDHIKQLIKRHYYTLAEDFDWQHLELKKETGVSRKVLQAGSNTYDFPAAVNPLKITKMWVKHGTWLEVGYGIKHSHYSASDPDADQRSDPVTNWAYYDGTGFEVWPTPASNGTADADGEVAFEGQKLVTTLTSTGSRLDMDDHLVTLMVAAEILAGQDQKVAAAVKAEAAQARLGRLRANLASKTRYVMGRGLVAESAGMPRHPTFIR